MNTSCFYLFLSFCPISRQLFSKKEQLTVTQEEEGTVGISDKLFTFTFNVNFPLLENTRVLMVCNDTLRGTLKHNYQVCVCLCVCAHTKAQISSLYTLRERSV